MTLWHTLVSCSTTVYVYTVCRKTSTFLFFKQLCQKLTDFNDFRCAKILRKLEINSSYIFSPYMYTVATLPWEIQKVIFQQYYSYVLQIICVITEETNCNCCTPAYLFTYCCLLLPIICIALFYGQFFFIALASLLFISPPMLTHNRLFSEPPTFAGTQHYLL